jgi:hypothetical protein
MSEILTTYQIRWSKNQEEQDEHFALYFNVTHL